MTKRSVEAIFHIIVNNIQLSSLSYKQNRTKRLINSKDFEFQILPIYGITKYSLNKKLIAFLTIRK